VRDDVSVDSESLLMTDFVDLKIKLTQFFRGVHRGKVCVCAFIDVSAHTYMSICVCTVFLKKSCYTNYILDFIVAITRLPWW
jgi:hypothetical protein